MKNTTLTALFVALTLVAPAALGDNRFPYQGNLERDGMKMSGTFDFQFRIFPVATGGSAAWTETQTGVRVTAGAFSVNLGNVTTIPNAALATPEVFLQISVKRSADASYVTLQGRQQLLNVPLARGTNGDFSVTGSLGVGGNLAVGGSITGNNLWERIYSSVANVSVQFGSYHNIGVSLANHSVFRVLVTGRLANVAGNSGARLFITTNNNSGTHRQTGAFPNQFWITAFDKSGAINTNGDFTCDYTVSSKAGSQTKFVKGNCLFDDGTLYEYSNSGVITGGGELSLIQFGISENTTVARMEARVTVWGVRN